MGEKYIYLLFALWMALIFAGMIAILVFVFRYINNKEPLLKKGDYRVNYAFLSKLPLWLKFLWWLILFSAIAVSLINTLRKH
jgi:uncharacterized membrane protein